MSSHQGSVQQSRGVIPVGNHTEGTAEASGNRHDAPAKTTVLQPLDVRQVTLAGEFGRRVNNLIEANILKIELEETYLKDFRRRGDGGYTGVGKFIDAVVRLAASRDPRLIQVKDQAITALLATQDADGYIGTVEEPRSRTKPMWDLSEMAYLIWGLVSDYRFFGTTASLGAAQALADWLLARVVAEPELRPRVFEYGPRAFEYDYQYGSEIPFDLISLGLDRAFLALGRTSGDTKYRDFVVKVLKLHEYDRPIDCGTTSQLNHAYAYLSHCLAQLDLYRETGDAQLLSSARRAIAFLRRGDGMLVTGSCSEWECWHDTQSGLQNTSETCAAAYLARLMDAMLQIDGESIYGDIMERDIYNALFAATSPDGSRSRYYTPFEGKRPFDLFGNRYCCSNNNKRFLADLQSWIYYRTGTGVCINLYSASTANLSVAPDVALRIEQHTDYPTSGDVHLTLDPSAPAHFELKLRIPRWCGAATVSVNGSAPQTIPGGQFYGIVRTWNPGDVVELKMPMEWRFIRGRRSQVGRAAILRGPVIFTFNPERNPEISAHPDYDRRLLKINPLEIAPPAPDDSVRPGGVSCVIQAWPLGCFDSPWLWVKRVPLVLTEYPDPGGETIYFTVSGPGQSLLTDDELL